MNKSGFQSFKANCDVKWILVYASEIFKSIWEEGKLYKSFTKTFEV